MPRDFVVYTPASRLRGTTLVEIMAPFFSRAALDPRAPTSTLSELGWGPEYPWNDILRSQDMATVDRFPVTHIRPVQSNKWKNQRGESAEQECTCMLAEWQSRR